MVKIDECYLEALNAKRKISVYLPPSYKREDEKRYPVIYMHDGQNLFDKNRSSFGCVWKIDESLNRMAKENDEYEFIVVGIDNGDLDRMNEYSPWQSEVEYELAKGFGGNGEKYISAIINDLKPLVDNEYRTLRDRDNTLIAGSSMGGLISLYALIKYQNVFSKGLIFSPAFWFARNELNKFIENTDVNYDLNIFISIGTMEEAGGSPKEYVEDANFVVSLLKKKSPNKIHLTYEIINGDVHDEDAWAKLFPNALKVLKNNK